MIEVVPRGNGFGWTMICTTGRVLAYTVETFPCVATAARAAKEYRAAFWGRACEIDHRMAACI